MPFMDRLRPPLTTVAFPHYQLGTEAAALLLARLAGHRGRDGDPAPAVRLEPELVIRGSVAPPPA
jgi:LacI family transcriptional regulator